MLTGFKLNVAQVIWFYIIHVLKSEANDLQVSCKIKREKINQKFISEKQMPMTKLYNCNVQKKKCNVVVKKTDGVNHISSSSVNVICLHYLFFSKFFYIWEETVTTRVRMRKLNCQSRLQKDTQICLPFKSTY